MFYSIQKENFDTLFTLNKNNLFLERKIMKIGLFNIILGKIKSWTLILCIWFDLKGITSSICKIRCLIQISIVFNQANERQQLLKNIWNWPVGRLFFSNRTMSDFISFYGLRRNWGSLTGMFYYTLCTYLSLYLWIITYFSPNKTHLIGRT